MRPFEFVEPGGLDEVLALLAERDPGTHLVAGGTGLVRLGIIPSLSSALLAASVNELVSTHTRARVQMRESSTDELLRDLLAKRRAHPGDGDPRPGRPEHTDLPH